jgi:hypothetical protein
MWVVWRLSFTVINIMIDITLSLVLYVPIKIDEYYVYMYHWVGEYTATGWE